MSYADIGIIAFAVLFGALGVWKGVQKTSLALGAFLISFIVAYFLAGVVAEAFLGVDSIKNFVMGEKGWSLYTWIREGISDTTMTEKSFIYQNFYKPIYDVVKSSKEISDVFTVQDGVALSAAFSLFAAIIGVGLFIVVRLLLCIVTMIIKSYFMRKKSIGNRVGGFFVGMVRGGVWAFVFTIIFSVVGGLSFMPAVDAIEDQYESAVVANYFNMGAYGLKNSTFIPSKDQFDRLVIKGGFNKKSGTGGGGGGGGEDQIDPLATEKLNLYSDIMNLNCSNGNKYSVSNGVVVVSEDSENIVMVNPADYEKTKFKNIVQAIVSYNNRIGSSIVDVDYKLKPDGTLAQASNEQINEYKPIVNNIWRLLYGSDGVYSALENYNMIITSDDFGTHTEQGVVDSINSNLTGYYNTLTTALDGLKTEYAKFDLFIAHSNVGELTLPTYPTVIQDKVYTGEPETDTPEVKRVKLYADFMNLNYADGDKYSVEDGEIVDNEEAAAIDPETFGATGFDQALSAVITYNNKIGEAIGSDGNGILSEADGEELDAYITVYNDIREILHGDYGLYKTLTAYDTIIGELDGITDADDVAAVNAVLNSYYNSIVSSLEELKTKFAELTVFAEDQNVGALDLPEAPELVQIGEETEEPKPEDPNPEEQNPEEGGDEQQPAE